MKYTDLKAWNKLTPEEKRRLKLVHGERFDREYNVEGKESISSKELKKGGTV